MLVCVIGIICSVCDVLEKGLEGCLEIKQHEIPGAALVTSYAGHPLTCWNPFPLQSPWTKWVSCHCEDFLPLLKERFYNPKWTSHSLNCSVIYYFTRSHSSPLLTAPSIYKSASARVPAHQSPHSTSRPHSRIQDPGLTFPSPHPPNTLPRTG